MAMRRAPDSSPAASAPLLQGEAPRLIFKHSPTCGISMKAHAQVSAFAEAHPDLPIHLVDVLAQRGLSQQIALDLGLTHESPQAILVADGRLLWSASHRAVTSQAITHALSALPPFPAGKPA